MSLSIDCYDCKSVAGNNKRCEDTFETDFSTYDLISRKCYYGFWKAHFCIKLKAVRADGSSILVRQCAVKDWGSRCGLIHFESPHGVEEVDGCLESCDFDGCNTATPTYKYNYFMCFISVVFVQMFLLLFER
ncbi:hypothetical protein ACF0H5_001081 [Mactra antiquata]